MLKTVDLQPQAGVRAERLRPGEAARLRLARALLHDPAALLLDEPIGDVDRGALLWYAARQIRRQASVR